MQNIFKNITFNSKGLVPIIAQEASSKEVLMMAWANKEAIEKTLSTGYMHYFSRSRSILWKKGESSGQVQKLKELVIDCDGDTILALVEQTGVACHTGRQSCFFNLVKENGIIVNQDVKTDPKDLYK